MFIVLQAITNIGSVISFYTQCGAHLEVFWTPSEQKLAPLYCFDPVVQTKSGYAVGAFNCLTDAFLTVLPAILIDHTKLSLKRKLGLACLLCLSVAALAAAVVKTYFMKSFSEVTDYTCKYISQRRMSIS